MDITHRGQVHFITGDYQKASEDYIKSIDLEPKFVFSHIQYNVAQYKLGNLSDAMKGFKKALRDFPESGDVNNYYGELLLDQQQFDEAIERFDKAIKLKPSNPLPYINKALLLFQWKQDPLGAERLCLQSLDGMLLAYHQWGRSRILVYDRFSNSWIRCVNLDGE